MSRSEITHEAVPLIEKLVLHNFQCHEDEEIVFTEPIVVVVGPNDVGKSAFVRAFRWLATNRPGGTRFMRHGARDCKVTAVLKNGIVTRSVGRDGNTYHLNGKKLVAFGTGVPEEVSHLLNLDEVNIQRQHDPLLWFTDSPGVVSKRLNSIVNLDLIDHSLSFVATLVRSAKSTVDESLSRLEKARKRRSDLKWVVMADRLLKRIERHDRKCRLYASRAARIDDLLSQRGEALRRIKRASTVLETARTVASEMESVLGNMGDMDRKVARIDRLMKELEQLEASACVKEVEAEVLRTRLERAVKKNCPVCGKSSRFV